MAASHPPSTPQGSLRTSALSHLSRLLGLAALAAAMAAPAAGGADAELLDRLRQKARAEDEQQGKEFGALLEQGRQFLERNEYEQALRVLRRAAELKPQDETCRQLVAQARGALAARKPGEILDRVRGKWRDRKNSLRRELDLGLFEAEQALAGQRFDQAAQHARRVLHGATYIGEGALAEEFRTRAQRILSAAGAGKGQAEDQRRQQALADRRQEAADRTTDSLRGVRERGWQYLEQGNYQKALAAAEQMVRLAPGSEQAQFLKSEALKAKEQAEGLERAREERKRAIADHMIRDLEEQMTLPEGVAEESRVVLPGKAAERRPHVRERAMEPWEQRLRAKLRQKVTFEFKNSSPTEACRYLAKLTESTILVDPDVVKDGRRVNLPKMTLSFDFALRWLCRFWRATYVVRDHAILVTRRGGRLNEPVMRDYDVSGLLMPLRSVRTTLESSTQFDETAPLHALATTGKTEVKEKPADKEAIGEGWAAFIRSTVASDSWSGGPGGRTRQQQGPRYSIQYRNGRIVVVHTPEVHRQIAELLENYRRARNLQVHLLARFLSLELDYLEEIGVNFAGSEGDPDDPFDDTFGFVDPREAPPANPDRDWQRWEVNANVTHEPEIGDIPGSFSSDELGGLSIRYHYLNHAEVVGVLTAVIKHRKGTLLIAPRLTCFNTQRANFQALTNFNYVRSVSADEEPEIGNVPDGIIFDVQPFISADRRYITVVLQPQLRTLQSLTSFSFLGGPLGRSVQLPTTRLTSVATTVTVPDGGSIIIGGLTEVNERHGLATLPFFYSVPGLRYLLRETRDAERRTSLVVLVTAEIVRDIFEEE